MAMAKASLRARSNLKVRTEGNTSTCQEGRELEVCGEVSGTLTAILRVNFWLWQSGEVQENVVHSFLSILWIFYTFLFLS